MLTLTHPTLFDAPTGDDPVGILAKFWYPKKLEKRSYNVALTDKLYASPFLHIAILCQTHRQMERQSTTTKTALCNASHGKNCY